MTADAKIRQANAADSEALESCMKAAYSAYQQRMDGQLLPPMNVDYRSEIASYPTWVVDLENRVVGGLIMSFDADQASIANIGVDPVYQGQGIGGRLLSFAVSIASQNGYSELRLATHVLLHENLSLYRHLGWEETGRDQTRVYMSKTI